MSEDKSALTVEIHNNQPIELMSLGLSFAAFSEEFCDFANTPAHEMQLYVRELRAGSLIADLVAISEQVDWLRKHMEVYASFVINLNDLVNFFLGKSHDLKEKPTHKQAKNLIKIVDPVAKDGGSQLNIIVADGGTLNIGSIDANAIQNSANRYIGPQLPSTQFLTDRIMILEQVKNDAKKQGDKAGIVEPLLIIGEDGLKDGLCSLGGETGSTVKIRA